MSNGAPVAPRRRAWPLDARGTALLVALCVPVGIALALVLRPAPERADVAVRSVSAPVGGLRADAVWPSGRRSAPPFALPDQTGRLVSLAGQRGRAVLLAFMDSRCKLICTLEGPTIHAAIRRLGGGAPVTLLVVSVNPWEDTAASTRAAAARWGLAGDWHWLRGSEARLRPVWRAYGIGVVRTAGDVSHSTAIYLIDRRGYERAGFNWPFAAAPVARNLRALLAARAS